MPGYAALSIAELLDLAYVAETAQKCAKVAVVMDDEGKILYGHARSIGDENGNFLRDGQDVRDGFLRITGRMGVEFFLPVSELARKHRTGEFGGYDWS